VNFTDLVNRRWFEAQQRIGLRPGALQLTWEITDDYPHFKKARGYAVCFHVDDNTCHLKFSTKMLRASPHRADAIVRHELGHVLDFLVPSTELDRWAWQQGVQLPHTAELVRADSIRSRARAVNSARSGCSACTSGAVMSLIEPFLPAEMPQKDVDFVKFLIQFNLLITPIALVLSYQRNKSVQWALVHSLFAAPYVAFVLARSVSEKTDE